MHIHCDTPFAVFLVGAFDEKKVMRFPDEGTRHGGLQFEPKTGLPIDAQLIELARDFIDNPPAATSFSVIQDYTESATLTEGRAATVYLGLIEDSADFVAPSAWPVFPDIIRRLPKDRSRLAYLKAWQVLTGGLKLDTRAVEGADLSSLLGDKDSE